MLRRLEQRPQGQGNYNCLHGADRGKPGEGAGRDDAADAAWCVIHVDEISRRETGEYREVIYALKVENREKEISLSAVVKRTERKGRFVRKNIL